MGRQPGRIRTGLLAALVLPVSALAGPAAAALRVDPLGAGSPATGLAAGLAGPGVRVVGVRYTGSPRSAGTFTGGLARVGFDSGVVLSTGSTGGVLASGAGTPALDALGAGVTRDSTVLELDVVPDGHVLSLDYVFASGEYDGYVGSGYDDVLGLLVTDADGATSDCATVADGPDPGAAPDPVSVDTVNSDTHRWLYRAGATRVLRCVATVTPGVPNRVVLAVGDVGDKAVESRIYLRAGSLASGAVVAGRGSTRDGYTVALTSVPTWFGPAGSLTVRGPGRTFRGTPVSLTVTGGTATGWGGGRFGRRTGCSFRVTVVDGGRDRDTVDVTVTGPRGARLLHVRGPLVRGDLSVRAG